MELSVSKQGSNLDIKTPLISQKTKPTKNLFEEFYGKRQEDISTSDLGDGAEMGYGCDVGSEEF